jgi:hypothetical protein
MSAIIFGIILMCLLVGVVILMFRPYDYGASVAQFKRMGKDDDLAKESIDTKWRSVRIRPGLIACRQVADLNGQVFLSREVPELPLPGCAERDCRCHYVFLDDRRSGIDRRVELARLGEFLSSSEQDRRRSAGRRMGDLAPA